MLTHAQRGGEVLLEDGSHTLNAELGGIAGVAGLFYRGIPGKRGAMDVEALRETIRPMTRQHMGTALVWMENTHNRAGGAVLPLAHMRAVYGLARDKDVPVHLDGARLFNAASSLGVPPGEIAQYSDSVCFCVSKGLVRTRRLHTLRQCALYRACARLPPHGRRQHAPGRASRRRRDRRARNDGKPPARGPSDRQAARGRFYTASTRTCATRGTSTPTWCGWT